MDIRWSDEKNQILKRKRGISFEAIEEILSAGEEVDVTPHPTRPNQKILVVRIRGYIHAVPFVEDEKGLFLKTIYPCRDLHKQYGGTP